MNFKPADTQNKLIKAFHQNMNTKKLEYKCFAHLLNSKLQYMFI